MATLTKDDVVARLSAACARAGSQKAWAEKVGVSAQYVCDVLMGRRDPGASILEPLGVHAEITYHITGMAPREQFRRKSR